MNRERRKLLERASALRDEALALLEEVRDGEQDAFDNMPPSFQEGERGAAMQETLSALDDVIGTLEDLDILAIGEG